MVGTGIKAGWHVVAILLAMVSTRAYALTVKLTDADPSSTVTLHVGDRLRLELATEPARGLRWKARTVDASHLEQLGKGIMPGSNRLDTAGTQILAWKALSPGIASVVLEYSRPDDDRTIPPARRMQLKIEVVAGELAPLPPGTDELLKPTVQPIATYGGELPCGDCLSMAVQFRLFAVGPTYDPKNLPNGVFIETRRYQGAPGGDKTIAGTGRFAVVHGTYADPSMTLYVLGALDGGTENYRVEADRLVQLDPQGLPIPTPAGRDSSLHRVIEKPE